MTRAEAEKLIGVEPNTHLIDWLFDGWTHCQHGTKEWCEGYLRNASAVIKAQDTALEAALSENERLRKALEPFAKGSIDVSGSAVIIGYPEAKEALANIRSALAVPTDRLSGGGE